MAEMELYPKELVGLELSFEESIYAIAFGLAEEIRRHGKGEVFKELRLTQEEMMERVKYCLDEVVLECSAYALRRVLGDLDSSNDTKMFDGFLSGSLDMDFAEAVENLQSSVAFTREFGQYVNYRVILAGPASVPVDDSINNEAVGQLYEEVKHLIDEVRFYDTKREQALTRIEDLMKIIKRRSDCPKDVSMERFEEESQDVDLDGPVSQIYWSYRSIKVLKNLRLETMKDVIEYFRDFNNFVNGDEITFLEWLVIGSVLRRLKLLPVDGWGCDFGSKLKDIFCPNVRICNALERGLLHDFGDFVMEFASGAAEGWRKIRNLRNLGPGSFKEVVRVFSEATIQMPEEICFPTVASDVAALDFDQDARLALMSCGINTIGELLAAYNDNNRFSGLRYLDNDLYGATARQLSKYGFI